MRKCRFCHEEIQDASRVCEHCGKELLPPVAVETLPAEPLVPTIARVSVVDVDMPFGSMVVFMVKWAIAAVPAFLILIVIGIIAGAVFGGLVTACAVNRNAPGAMTR